VSWRKRGCLHARHEQRLGNSYHVDTCVLYPVVFEDDKDITRQAKSILAKASQFDTVLRVSFVAAGELAEKLMGAGKGGSTESQNELARLIRYLSSEFIHTLAPYQVPKGSVGELCSYVEGILKVDYQLDVNDAIIIATAMVDSEAIGLITLDPTMLNSLRVNDFISAKMEGEGRTFRIAENPWRHQSQ
jgi:predicted nucleic acid-binding protein